MLDPQPPEASESWETKPGIFCFYTGDAMEGHELALGPVAAPDGCSPEFDWTLRIWTWQPRRSR